VYRMLPRLDLHHPKLPRSTRAARPTVSLLLPTAPRLWTRRRSIGRKKRKTRKRKRPKSMQWKRKKKHQSLPSAEHALHRSSYRQTTIQASPKKPGKPPKGQGRKRRRRRRLRKPATLLVARWSLSKILLDLRYHKSLFPPIGKLTNQLPKQPKPKKDKRTKKDSSGEPSSSYTHSTPARKPKRSKTVSLFQSYILTLCSNDP